MVITSAPGKVILFGEHAVVYGEPALAGAIDRRVYVHATKIPSGVKIVSDKSKDFRYAKKAVELAFDYTGRKCGLDIKVDSELPPASGLGSSAAVSVATILAVSKLLGAKLSRAEIAKLGHRAELEVQGAASPTDTAISTFGGVLFIQPKKQKYQRINATLPMVVGYTGIERSTKMLVQNVKSLKEKFPEIVNPIIKDIGKITREAKRRLENNEDVGELMNINHGLLDALGVSTEKLNELVYAARNAGAKGAKLTGAGGGGCMIAYAPKNAEKVARAIEKCGCAALKTGISGEGVRVAFKYNN
ncbi:MAG: mevalonate kinase [Methanobacteriota archaeon]